MSHCVTLNKQRLCLNLCLCLCLYLCLCLWSFCVWNWVIIWSSNGLLPIQSQIIYKTNADLLSVTPRGTYQWNFIWNSKVSIQENTFENFVCEMAGILFIPQCVELSYYRVVYVLLVHGSIFLSFFQRMALIRKTLKKYWDLFLYILSTWKRTFLWMKDVWLLVGGYFNSLWPGDAISGCRTSLKLIE